MGAGAGSCSGAAAEGTTGGASWCAAGLPEKVSAAAAEKMPLRPTTLQIAVTVALRTTRKARSRIAMSVWMSISCHPERDQATAMAAEREMERAAGSVGR